MFRKIKGRGSSKNTEVGDIRASQVITTYGPGAIANLNNATVMISGLDYWDVDKEETISEDNLQKLLKVKKFYSPPISHKNIYGGDKPSLRAIRFPEIYHCPQCHKMYKLARGEKNKCSFDGKTLLPSSFICVCINGHVTDFPYKWWVHSKYNKDYEEYENHEMEIISDSKQSGLRGIVVHCRTCNLERTMEGCMSEGALDRKKCNGMRPWLPDAKWEENCKAKIHVVQRNASNVYFSMTYSALTLPKKRDLPSRIKAIRCAIVENSSINTIRSLIENSVPEETVLNVVRSWVSDDYKNVTYDEVIKALDDIDNFINDNEDDFGIKNIFEDEYGVLCEGTIQDATQTEYQAEETLVPDSIKPIAVQVNRIKRLRVVMALGGFRRITPDYPQSKEDVKNERRFWGWNEKSYVPLSEKKLDWLPAVELLGEGIFIRFKEEVISEWERHNMQRYEKLYQSKIEVEGKDVSKGRYVFLHTFAHLLIRQLTLECGYSGASLKERIYSTFRGSDFEMCGVLIYTASADSDGSLGGLVRMGLPENLERIICNMVYEATWCSSDPVCMTVEGQGRMSANYAACHACAMLPETSCENGNVYLDRASIVGGLSDESIGLMRYLL